MSERFTSPEESDTYVRETASLLEQLGYEQAAQELADIGNTAWTTSSEWLGELGLAIRRIKKRGDVPELAAERMARIMKAVHKGWPRPS